MSDLKTPSVNVIQISASSDSLHFDLDDEFDDVADEFDRTPRPNESPRPNGSPSPRSEAGSVTVLECKRLLRPNESRLVSATSQRPLTGKKVQRTLLTLRSWIRMP